MKTDSGSSVKNKEKRSELEKRIEKEGLVPDPLMPGRFIKPIGLDEDGAGSLSNKIGYQKPNNWVFHDSVVIPVLAGRYDEIMPYSGEFVTTMNCTNRCVSPCPYEPSKKLVGVFDQNDFKNSKAHMQSREFALWLLDKLSESGIKGLVFTGGGEPFLFRHLEDCLSHSKDLGIDNVLYTNGNAVTMGRAERVFETEPLLVRVSLNCGTQEYYNLFHRPEKPDKALDNTLRSIDTFARFAMQTSVTDFGVSVVFNELNYQDLENTAQEIAKIAERNPGGITYAVYRPAFRYHGGDQTDPFIVDKAYEIIETKVRPLLDEAGVQTSNLGFRYSALKEDTRDYDLCFASGLYVELSPSGDLHLCCDRNCHPDWTIGNLTENTLDEIWAGDKRKAVLDYVDSGLRCICPNACKPALANNQFAQIERIRQSGGMYKVELWVEEQQKMPIPKMVNF